MQKNWTAPIIALLTSSTLVSARPTPASLAPVPSATVRAVQPVQEYFIPFADAPSALDLYNQPIGYTHLGTDYGRMGPSADRIHWRPGAAWVDLRGGHWAGMWHSLAGLAREREQYLDFNRCYPHQVRDPFQPHCVGLTVRAQGVGTLKIELKSPAEEVLWKQTVPLTDPDHPLVRTFDFPSQTFRSAKLLNWVAEPGAVLGVDQVGLIVEYPPLPFDQRAFLVAYSKLARCAGPGDSLVKDRAQLPAGDFDAIPASGLYALATAAAVERGVVEPAYALQVLQRTQKIVRALPRADGLLPHFVSKTADGYRIHPGTEYSTVDTSLYYHGMLLAATMLGDTATEAALRAEVRAIDFHKLRDANGRIVHGLHEDGRPLASTWNDWGGETALVLMLEKMSQGDQARPIMNGSGNVDGGVGFIAELQSLFYPQFGSERPDALTGTNWLKARKSLLKAQRDYFPKRKPECAAAKLGLFGLSAGEGFRGQSYDADGVSRADADIIRPHYVLMSGLIRETPDDTYAVLKTMEDRGLMPPWGLVENFKSDLSEYLPMLGSLNAAFECLAAYHLQAWAAGRPDGIYDAARKSPPLVAAAEVFYPPTDRIEAASK